MSRDLIALDLPGRCEWERLSYTVREGVHSPVKVNDQLGDAYKQVVNSYGVRRQVWVGLYARVKVLPIWHV